MKGEASSAVRHVENAVRVAVVQIEAHPALYISDSAPLEEPFLYRGTSLAKLARHGFSVKSLQKTCIQHYLDWHLNRLAAILRFLEAASPDIVVFPEYSIPWQAIPSISGFAQRTGATVFAGTHTVQTTPEALAAYRAIGLDGNSVRGWTKKGLTAVLPIVQPHSCRMITKKAWSPFEESDVSRKQDSVIELKPVTLRDFSPRVKVLPAICAEATRTPNIGGGDYLLTIIVAYGNPSYFTGFIEQQRQNKHAVVLCNDAALGGSSVLAPHDGRTDDWLTDTTRSLPQQEEAVFVMDIRPQARAVEVATAAPVRSYSLVKLCSIVYSADMRASAISRAFSEARGISHSDARARFLAEKASSADALVVQARRLRQLAATAEKGIDGDEWWDAIGEDCLVAGQGLRDVEASLASHCHDNLIGQLSQSASIAPEGAQAFLRFLGECETRKSRHQTPTPIVGTSQRASLTIIDRDTEVGELLTFLDNPRMKLCQILGQEQIGKSTVLEKALAQSGLAGSSCKVVFLTDDTSAEFVLGSIVYGSQPLQGGESFNLNEQLALLPDAVARCRLLILENFHCLQRGADTFRNNELQVVSTRLCEAIEKAKITQLVVLSRRFVPEGLIDPIRRHTIWVRGFENERLKHGVDFLDSQLRHAGMSPSDVVVEEKREIVKTLGGHPVALALAAANMYQRGSSSVVEQLRQRRGFWKTYVDRLVSTLELTEQDNTVLRLLSVFHVPVARAVLQQVVTFPLDDVIDRLVSFCLVEVMAHQRLWVSGLLRVNWESDSLPVDLRNELHQKAAEWLGQEAGRSRDLSILVEAQYHARLAGIQLVTAPNLIDAQIRVARELYERQEYIQAKQVMDSVVAIKRTRDLIRLSALIDARCGDFDPALTKAREVFKEDAGDTWLLEQIGKAALNRGKVDIAASLVEIARGEQVLDARVALLEGRVLARRRMLPEAIASFERARDLTKRNAWPFFYLGKMYMRLGDLEEARKVFEDGQEFSYSHCRDRRVCAFIEGLLLQCYILLDDPAAPRLLDLLQQREINNAEVVLAEAMLAIKNEGIAEAHKAYERLSKAKLNRADDRCQLHLYYGKFLQHIDAWTDACREYRLAHEADRTNLYPLILWAKALYKMAEKAASESAWDTEADGGRAHATECGRVVRKILQLDSTNKEARYLQEDVYSRFQVTM